MKTNTQQGEPSELTHPLLTAADAAAVRDILAEQLDVQPAQVTSGALIEADLGADSLDKVEIVMKLEERFSVTITDDSAETVSSVEDVCDVVAKALGRQMTASG